MANPSYDNGLCAAVSAATSLSYAFTVGAVANPVMVVFVRTSATTDVVTSVTVNSATPFQTIASLGNGAPYGSFYMYLFLAPAAGSATISITTSTSCNILSGSMSFANVFQGDLDSNQTGLVLSGTNFILTTNPAATNTMLGMFIWNSAAIPTAGNLVTLQKQVTALDSSTATAWIDTTNLATNAQVFPSCTTGSNTSFAGFTFTLAPAPTSVPIVGLVTSVITNRNVYTLPATPALSAAGYTLNDPTFGSWMARVTDSNSTSVDPLNPATGESWNLNANTTQHGWSPDSRIFYVQRTDGNYRPIYFDPVGLTFTWGSVMALYDDLTWDSTNPNLLYGSMSAAPNHHTVGMLTLSTNTVTTLFDAATVVNTVLGGGTFPTGDTYLNTIMCQKGILYVLCGGTGAERHMFIIAYPLVNPSAAQVLNTQTMSGGGWTCHSIGPDQTGRYCTITPSVSVGPFAPYPIYIWDTVLNTVTPVTQYGAGHSDTGINGEMLNQDSISTFDAFQYVIRSLAFPNSGYREVFHPLLSPIETYAADHSCCNDAIPGKPVIFTSSTYRYNSANGSPYTYTSSPLNTVPWRPLDGEIVQVNTNPLFTANTPIRRICHNFALADPQTAGNGTEAFQNQPKVNVSPNGLWALFDSNWMATLGTDSRDGTWRKDVFMVYLGAPSIPCNQTETYNDT